MYDVSLIDKETGVSELGSDRVRLGTCLLCKGVSLPEVSICN